MKEFVIDTNVIMSDPYCVKKIKGKIYIPTTVLEELDNHKNDNGEKGRNVREFTRIIYKEDLENVKFVNTCGSSLTKNDDRIVECAFFYGATLITNDILMLVKARAKGILTEKYSNELDKSDKAYTGLLDLRGVDEETTLLPNQYVLRDRGLFVNKNGNEKRVSKDEDIFGIRHKNVEQKCAIDALLDDNIKLVTLSGKAGTGKTLIAIACGLRMTVEANKYQRLLVSRPVIPMGNDIGYLPGDISEKLGPWMQPIFDNIDFLFNIGEGEKKKFDAYKELEGSGILKVEALTYIRGRSIPDQYMIIDEAQNLTQHEVKTIISRAGEGTKIVLTGDPDQIDNTKLDSINNGLSYVIDKFKDQSIAAHITLSKGERSELADIASDIL